MKTAEEDWPRALRNTYGSLSQQNLSLFCDDPRIKNACKLAVDALTNLSKISTIIVCEKEIERAEGIIDRNQRLKEELQR